MVNLKQIDESNLSLCEELERKSNKYVGSPMWVIGLAYVYRDVATAYGIYNDNTMVGLVILFDLKDKYSFNDLFIADNYQGRGFGTKAVECIINKFKAEKKYNEISILVHNTNYTALYIYEKTGFKHVGTAKWDKNFLVMKMFLDKQNK